MEKEFPKRKHPRLDKYDYSSAGAYFITICTQDRRCLLSQVEGERVECTVYGRIAEQQLWLLEERYPFLTVDRYVIMPNHIHAIFVIKETAGVNPRPTIMDMVCAYKSLTTKACKAVRPIAKLFQTSFYEHVIRCAEECREIVQYIEENPMRWHNDKLYIEQNN